MKFEREATTKNGRRTWKVTYELVRGPEPKPKAGKPRSGQSAAEKSAAWKDAPAKRQPEKPEPQRAHGRKKKSMGNGAQLGMFKQFISAPEKKV